MVYSHKSRGRPAYSLLEIMAVLFIISILTALAAGGVFSYILGRQKANAQNLVSKLYSATQRQWSAVTAFANRQPMPPAVLNLAGGNAERARVILQKLYLKQAFPMTVAEATTPITVTSGGQTFTLNPLPGFGGVNPPGTHESAVLLLLALERNNVLDRSILEGGAIGTVGSNEFLKDPWQQPLVFARWPYLNPWLNPNGITGTSPPSGANSNDPGDPNGTLCDSNWLGMTRPAPFETLCHPLPNPLQNMSGQPMSFLLQPMIVSAGPDKLLGLDYTSFQELSSDSNDNITSANLPPSPS